MSKLLNLKNKVMARIYLEYTKNLLVEHPDYFMLAAFLIVSFVSVSIYDVFANTAGILKTDVFSVFNFLIAAVKDTNWIIQAFLVGLLVRMTFLATRLTYRKSAGVKWPLAKLRY